MGGGEQTSTQSSDIPSWLKSYYTGADATKKNPAITGILPEAEKLYAQGGPAYYPGSTNAGFTPAQLQAQQATLSAANTNLQPNALQGAASDQMIKTLQGGYQNPYIDDVGKSVMASVLPQVQGQAELAGRFGSGSEAQALTTAATNALAPYAYNASAQERQNQLNTAQNVNPYLAGQEQLQYGNIGQIGQVGAQQQQQGQADINADINRYNYNSNLPQLNLQQLAQYVSGTPAGQVTTMTQPGQSPWQTILGGLFGGAGLGMQAYAL